LGIEGSHLFAFILSQTSQKKNKFFSELAENPLQREAVSWLKAEPKKLKGEVLGIPSREEINLPVKEQLIVELYSK